MPRAGLTPSRIVDEAAILVDEVGWEQLTLAALAKRLGVKLPSLYKHVAGLPALRRLLAVRAKTELATVLTRAIAGKSCRTALRSLTDAFIGWARQHPGLYPATVVAPVAGDADDERASEDAVQVIYAVLAGYGLDDERKIDVTRSLRAALHGFVCLQEAGGFGMERAVDDSLGWLIGTFDTACGGPVSSR